jgi:hypothetical protein
MSRSGDDSATARPERSASASEPVAKAQISVTLSSRPESAQLFLDDRLVSGNPATMKVPNDGSRHTVRAEAQGYAVQRQELTYDRDQSLVLTLAELPHAPLSSAPAKAKAVRGAPRPRAKCDPPYVIDARGVKRFKPECL